MKVRRGRKTEEERGLAVFLEVRVRDQPRHDTIPPSAAGSHPERTNRVPLIIPIRNESASHLRAERADSPKQPDADRDETRDRVQQPMAREFASGVVHRVW